MTAADAQTDAFPHKGYPLGWYQVAWAGELAPRDVRPLRYFGRDLVLWRGSRGGYHVLDAHCLHLGAHLGHGGKVTGDSITCPFHGWRWAGDGRNELVPMERKATDRCRMRAWDVVVANGIVWVWYDDLGRPPLFPGPVDLPGVAEGRRYDVYPHCSRGWRNVRVRAQYIPENNVDVEHLRWIHKAKGPIDAKAFEEDGYLLRVSNTITYGYGKESTRLTPDGPIEVEVKAELWGMGFQYTFFPLPDEAVSIQAQTPVDEDHCDMFQTLLVYGEEGFDPTSEPEGMAAARVREQFVQIERDIPIWENMKYLSNPSLSPEEAPTMYALRKWAERFYPGDAARS
jgi:3-ketosteroid 9alpha-monooxygenase subunit A